jgi:hypothetical protein
MRHPTKPIFREGYRFGESEKCSAIDVRPLFGKLRVNRSPINSHSSATSPVRGGSPIEGDLGFRLSNIEGGSYAAALVDLSRFLFSKSRFVPWILMGRGRPFSKIPQQV